MRRLKWNFYVLTAILTTCFFPLMTGDGYSGATAQIKTPSTIEQEKQVAAPMPAVSPIVNESGRILTRLPNGLLVYIFRDARFPLVCARLYVRAGSANEKPEQAGISHVLEHMVFKGTSHRPKGQVARDVEARGGYINAATSFDKTWYMADMPAEYWRVGIDVVKDMAFQATLDPEELEAEKNVVISELKRGEDSPMRKLYESLQVAALKNTPYGRPIIGFEDTIKALTADDLRAYVKRWYQPQNMMLLVGGDINPDEALEYAQTLFGKLENSSDLNVPQPLDLEKAANGSKSVEVVRGPWNKVYLGLAFPVPGYEDLRSNDLDVLCYLLGGDATSDLYRRYKYDLQLVDSIDASNMSLARAGMLAITAQLDPEKVDKFWRDLTEQLSRLPSGSFEEDAISRAKLNLEDGMDRAGETLNGLVSWKGTIVFDFGGEQGEDNIRFTQRNVDQQQLTNAIRDWLSPNRARLRVFAPENANLPDFAQIMSDNWPAIAPVVKAPTQQASGSSREVIELENGCKLILLPDSNAHYIAFDLIMAGGNAMLKPYQQGLANLTARLLTDGSGDFGNMAFERWLAERAAAASARAGIQTFAVSLTGPSRFNADFFNIFRDILRKPRFEPQELAREVNNMKAAIRQRDDRPLTFMFSKLNPFLFPGGQSYGYDHLGTPQTLDTFNAAGVRDFWTIQSSQPWILAVAGDFDRSQILNFVKSLPMPHANPFKTPPPVWQENAKDLTLKLPGRNQAHLLRIFKTVPPTHPDAPALTLLQSVLSGQSGLLFTRLRDQEGLGYSVTAFNRSMPQTGFMAFYIGTSEDKLKQAGDGFSAIIDEIKSKPLPQELLEAGANKLLGDYLRDLQSLGARATEAATDAILDYPPHFQKQQIELAAKVTPEQLRDVAAKYLVNPYEITLTP